jgi:hypothetical protein
MLKFRTDSKDKRVQIVVEKANRAYENPTYIQKFLAIKKFDPAYTSKDVNAAMLWAALRWSGAVVEIKTYWRPWGIANGKTFPSEPLVVWLNTAKFKRSDASIVATLHHEAWHVVNNVELPRFILGHGNDNSPKMTHDPVTLEGGCVPEVGADLAYLMESGFKSTKSSAII